MIAAEGRVIVNSRGLIAVAVTAGIALAACGGSAPSKPPSPSALASRIGCTGYSSMSPTLFAREEGSCTLNGDDLDIVTFSTTANEDNWTKAASSFGGGVIVKGSLWAVGTGSQASAEAVKTKLGGTIAN
jgi:hypothetical protein